MTLSSSRIPRAGRRLLALGAVLALAALAVATLAAPAALATTTGTTPPLSTTTVNNGPGDQSDPHVSGSLVTYTSALSGDSEVRYHDLASRTATRLTSDLLFDSQPAVAADGSVIAWTKCQSASITDCDVWQATGGAAG